jgi:hypothetical protein
MAELYPQSEQKKPWQSKTLWTNLIIAAGAFIPAIQPFLGPEALSTLFLVVNTVLRFTTKTGVSIS